MYFLFDVKPSLSISTLIEFLTSTKINMNNKISKKIFEISKYCKFFSFKSTKLLSINVKKVKKPRNSVILDRVIMIIFFSKILT